MIDALSRTKESGQTITGHVEMPQGGGAMNDRLFHVTVPVQDISAGALVVSGSRVVRQGIEFIKDRIKIRRSNLIVYGSILLLMAAAVVCFLLEPEFSQINSARMDSVWGRLLIGVTLSLLVFKCGFYLFNLVLYLLYKPIASVTDNMLPTCTVIVPAFNEGEQVWHTLMSLAASDYPREKLQLIAIDDGSADDTWAWMQRAKEELGDRLSIYKQPKNKGKRQALYRGFNLGKGEVFVTVDSDSEVKPDTLRNLVSPFVVNKKCGAVAGNVQVLNNETAPIPRMLNVSFVFSFEFVRSAESMLKTVLCTPGALAAYRREAVFGCLPEWIHQTFMGKPSDIGEDRAMTNMILKQGYETVFQRNACVLTKVPEKYKGLYKMFIRWGRSNVRENIMMGQYVFKSFRTGSKIGARLLFVNQWIKLIMAYPALMLMLMFVVTFPVLFLCSTMFSILVFASIPVLFHAKRYKKLKESIWAYPYAIMYAFGLFWITPYAIATAHRRGWLTRG